uniref:Uncharacterized protein n=1 Tax=Ditylenchus dipsaci TaxID=166011 RepID=A0A915E393_9BILA
MNSTDQLNFRTLKTKLMKLLEDKFYLENSRIHVLATFLNPRFKDYYSANTLQFNQKASKWLLEEVGEQEGELDAEQDLSSPAPKMIRKEKSFFDDDDDEVPRVQIFKMSGTEAEMALDENENDQQIEIQPVGNDADPQNQEGEEQTREHFDVVFIEDENLYRRSD